MRSLASISCGYGVQKQMTDLCMVSLVTHNHLLAPFSKYGKVAAFTHKIAQLRVFLCTNCTHKIQLTTSVIKRFVHTIHRAYKELNEVK